MSIGRELHADIPRGDDTAILDDDHAVRDGLGAITQSNGPAGDCNGLGSGGRRGREKQANNGAADHFTSPSPGWPSSKSLTGRFFGLLASYISAPSIHTLSGRE